MLHQTQFTFTLLLALTLAGCAAPASKVRVDKVEGTLPNCSSFGWLAVSGDAASFTEQRVRAETMQALQAKGYALDEEKPQCRITYHLAASTEQVKSGPSVGVGAGGGSGGIGGGIGVSIPIGRKKVQAGTFTLDVVDTARNAQVWSGSVDARFKSTDLSAEEAQSVVQKVLAEYPDKK